MDDSKNKTDPLIAASAITAAASLATLAASAFQNGSTITDFSNVSKETLEAYKELLQKERRTTKYQIVGSMLAGISLLTITSKFWTDKIKERNPLSPAIPGR